MPQISKLRIVNFQYNDGKRLIADELYDFSNNDNNKGMNVLINLANGGGKSVLVQLMMQPVIPRAKVAGRRIESFFNKASDHCFILLEWHKDNSTEKLLTGIAMSAADSLISEDNNSRGRAIKYYTFYSSYSQYNTDYDIINMPLSRKENSRFIAADFDFIRKLSRNSGGKLCYYASEDKAKWEKKLSEYDLEQSEWRMMEKLNSVEGGLTKYFEEIKNSDQLIDKLIIPTIESKIVSGVNKEDNSLSSILMSFVKQYQSRQDDINDKKQYEAFAEELERLKPEAVNLWETADSLTGCIGNLFGLSDSVTCHIAELENTEYNCGIRLNKIAEKIKKINWEKASDEYYKCKNDFEEAYEALEVAEKEETQLKNNLDSHQRNIRILECADYNQRLRELESSIAALQTAVREQENGSENRKQLAVLKYSAYHAVLEELPKYMKKQSELSGNIRENQAKYEGKSAELKIIIQKSETLKREYNKKSGRWEAAAEETDRAIQKLNSDLMRRLDGCYAGDELDAVKKCKEKDKSTLENKLLSEGKKFSDTEEKINSIPQKTADIIAEVKELETEMKALNRKINDYMELEDKIRAVCNQHSLDFSHRFTDYIRTFLSSELEKAMTDEKAVQRKKEILTKAVTAAKRGTVHIPHAAIEYLNSTGVRYTTCEKYLLDLTESGKITSEKCSEILKNYPSAAYGILIDDKEKKKLFEFEREKWLPMMIPLFSAEKMKDILNGSITDNDVIAFYSESYFEDKEHYISNLENEMDMLEKSCDRISSQIVSLTIQLETADAFNFSESWYHEHEQELSVLQQKINRKKGEKESLEKRRQKLLNERTAISQTIRQLESNIREADAFFEKFNNALSRIEEENNLYCEITKLDQKVSEAESQYTRLSASVDDLADNIKKLECDIAETEAIISELQKAKTESETAEEAEIISGSWRDLITQYRELLRAQEESIASLSRELQNKNERAADCSREIAKRDIDKELYKNVVYSEEKMKSAKEMQSLAEKLLEETRKNNKKLSVNKGRAESSFERAKEVLEPFGKPLDLSQIGSDFDKRISQANAEKAQTEECRNNACNKKQVLNNISEKLEDILALCNRPEKVNAIALESDVRIQYRSLYNKKKEHEADFNKALKSVKAELEKMSAKYSGSARGIPEAIDGLNTLIECELKGDKYFTLTEHIDAHVINTKRIIAKIDTDLKEFNNNRQDLIRQCTLQGQLIYEGLRQIASSSRVTVYDGKPRQQMIRFDIPPEVDPLAARSSIEIEIDEGTRELAAIMEKPDAAVTEIQRTAERIVGSKTLLRKYIRQDSIVVQAYKIDRNPRNSGYRTWEKTQVNNSGAEKFIVYFAVILSLMNYTRSNPGGINDKGLRSVLILDNPFGATSSRHILMPMFSIAEHFKVQMVCLSDINKTDVINCFDIVIKAILKQRPLSTNEILTHEGNETIEHGYYRSEQLEFF